MLGHLGQDVVAGAVQDAEELLDAVGGQALAQGQDDGDAAAHRGLEGDLHAFGRGRGQKLVAVMGQQGLVGGDHVLAALDGGEHVVPGGVQRRR